MKPVKTIVVLFARASWPYLLVGVLISTLVGLNVYRTSEENYYAETTLFITPVGDDTSAEGNKSNAQLLSELLNSDDFYKELTFRLDLPSDLKWNRSSYTSSVAVGVSAVSIYAFQSSPDLALKARDYLGQVVLQKLSSNSLPDGFNHFLGSAEVELIDSKKATLYESRKSLFDVLAVALLLGIATGALGGVISLSLKSPRILAK